MDNHHRSTNLEKGVEATREAIEQRRSPEDCAGGAEEKDFQRLKRRADHDGDADAQFELGVIFQADEKDEEAEKYYRKAAVQGNTEAQNELGNTLGRLAEKRESVEAHTSCLGFMCRNHYDDKSKYRCEAVQWYRKAAEQGFSYAQNNLAFALEKGNGTDKDEIEAVVWYRKAAEQNIALAQYNYGRVLKYGIGCDRDETEAAEWCSEAASSFAARWAETNSAEAAFYVGYLHEHGFGVCKNDISAITWYRIAAENGNADGQCNLGVMLANGRGTYKKDEEEAVKYYSMAAERGSARGKYMLANVLYYGKGIEADKKQAINLLRQAAEKGYPAAQNSFGFRLEIGDGITKNENEAIKWYRRAAYQGDALAYENLAYMYENVIGDIPKLNAIFCPRRLAMMICQGHMHRSKYGSHCTAASLASMTKRERMEESAKMFKEAIRIYRKRIRDDDDDEDARYCLGNILSDPIYPRHDFSEATDLFKSGYDHGDVRAMYCYGRALLDGRGANRDVELGLELIQKAASMGWRKAMFEVGTMFEYGDGFDGSYVRKNIPRAIECYKAVARSPPPDKLEFVHFDAMDDVAQNIEWHTTEDVLGQTVGILLSWELAGQAFLFAAASTLSVGNLQSDHYAALLVLLPSVGIVLAVFSILSSLKTAMRNNTRRGMPLKVYCAKRDACKALLGSRLVIRCWNDPERLTSLAKLVEVFAIFLSIAFLTSWIILLVAESLSLKHDCSDWWHSTCMRSIAYCRGFDSQQCGEEVL